MAKASGELTPGLTPRGKTVLKAFDYQDVRLLPGMLLAQVEQARQLYSSISNDDILKGFRREAGRPAPGDGMKGWCKSTSAVIFGQLISGMVRLGRATDDGALIDKAITLFEGWLETLPPDGNARMRAYDWDKLVCGLVDLGRYSGSDRAVPALRRTVAWASRTFDRGRQPADGHDFWGAGPGDTPEWYTLPENLYRAYLLTGDPLFKEFADDVAVPRLLAAVRRQRRAQPRCCPCTPTATSIHFRAAPPWPTLVTGDERYLRICINGYDFMPAHAVLRHRRLRPRRAADAARRQPRPLARLSMRLSRGNSVRHLGGVQAVALPDGASPARRASATGSRPCFTTPSARRCRTEPDGKHVSTTATTASPAG